MPLSGEIGLAGFTGLAFALLPSEGVLRLVPADQGASLVSALGGSLDYTSVAAFKKKVGSGPPSEFEDTPFVVEASWSGQALPATLSLESAYSTLAREVEGAPRYEMKGHTQPSLTLPAAPTLQVGEYPVQWRELGLGAVRTWSYVVRVGLGPLGLLKPNATVGIDLMRMADLAVDPVNHKLGIKAASALKLQDYRPVREAALKKALEPAPVEEGKEAPSEEDKKKARIAALKPLASWYDGVGQPALSAPLWKEVTEGEADQCGNWLSLGRSLMRTGNPADALSASRKAAELYDAWSSLSLEERTKQQKAYDAAMKKKAEWTGTVPQDHKCHVAWGDVAAEMLAMKDYTGIAAIYPSKMDLDEELALVAGNALLLQGKTEQAQAAYLRAIAVERTGSPAARVGMILTARSWEQAQAQLGASGWSFFFDDPYLLSVYLDAARKFGGEATAKAEVTRLLEMLPSDPALLIANGDYSKAADRIAEISARMPGNSGVQVMQARLLLAQGKGAEAKAAATKATELDPTNALAWYTLAGAEQSLNELDNAAKHLARASQLRASNPAYASLGN
ncbi:MAG TPA: tetratricopeptide repeat protein [Myxococcota bacterium]|nr:tetratricopeptide repeat protein [Myxococcota bacterium]